MVRGNIVRVAVLLPGLCAAAPLSAQTDHEPVGAADAAATITAADLRDRIGILADDSMRGRDTPSPELEQAARYVAEQFRSFGLQPGNGDSYLQPYPLTLVGPGPVDRQALRLRGPSDSRTLDPRTEFVAVPVGRALEGGGPLVRVDPSEEQADLTGRVAVISVTPAALQRVFGRVRHILAERGARGAILVVRAPAAYLAGIRRFFGRRRVSLGEPNDFPAPVMLVSASELPSSLAEALREERPLPPGWSAVLRSDGEVEAARGWNAIGWLEGSDPRLKHEYVLFTAHMDHVGVGRPVDGDSIYNGADDDASGTATVVELAEAFARTTPRPRRSLIFMTVSGEEKGLFGSRWYTEHPLFPLARTVADLNIDMIGRNWRDTVVAIGKAESSLGPLVEEIAAAHPELHMAVVDDRWPDERFYFRSDHYNFARKGVPILFFFSGVHEDYHRPSDEPSKIEYGKTARIGRLIYRLGRAVADADQKPRWDEQAYRRVVEGGDR
ncbi:MAG: M20/M25/M40 family metallo-hydrolase [Gemmatimonadota bacterium]